MHLYDLEEDDIPARPSARKRTAGIVNSVAEIDIEHSLGRFGVAANGDVAGIEFDETSLRRMGPAAVGASLVAAYRAAIHQARQRHMDDRTGRRG
jgi:hypothetical protein